MILGILFYLLQAHEYLQEGMTYRLGRSFYLAWIGIFFFLMIGLRRDWVWDSVENGVGLGDRGGEGLGLGLKMGVGESVGEGAGFEFRDGLGDRVEDEMEL